MKNVTGYAVVSQVYKTVISGCGIPGCTPMHTCPYPKRPSCNAICLHRHNLDVHPECLEYERLMRMWQKSHQTEEPTGGTRIGPLHYFSECGILLRPGPRRKDARVVSIDAGMANLLGLPICKECIRKMAPFEEQMGACAISVVAPS